MTNETTSTCSNGQAPRNGDGWRKIATDIVVGTAGSLAACWVAEALKLAWHLVAG